MNMMIMRKKKVGKTFARRPFVIFGNQFLEIGSVNFDTFIFDSCELFKFCVPHVECH